MATIEDFSKLSLKVATVEAADRVPGSEKLLRLSVSLGDEKRQILAGIGKAYEPENLVGKQIIVIANLEPRMLMGLESQGMLLAASPEPACPVGRPAEGAASDQDGPAVLVPDRKVPDGSEIR